MLNISPTIFDEITQIEQQAEEIVSNAYAQAKALHRAAEEQVCALAEETERAIEHKRAELAEEYKAKTERALAQIDADFLKEEAALEAVRELRFNALVEQALSSLRRSLLGEVVAGPNNDTKNPK